MNESVDPDLERLIAAVADGDPVNWRTEAERRPDLAPMLAELRVAESVAQGHRAAGDRTSERARSEPEAPGFESWGQLRILEPLGRGGFADVFRAFDPRLEREVALKLIRPGRGTETRVLQEARRMARVRHANVLVVHGAERHRGRAGFWTDLVDGMTLEALLEAHGTLGPEEAAHIGVDLCRALAAVHAAGLLHRDVKTTNVIREQGGRIVLLDFGAGSELAPDRGVETIEDGTPFTLAPEEWRGEPLSRAADLYGVGVLLYRLVSHRFPVEAATYAELRAAHGRGAHTPLRDRRPDLPAGFVRVVERALDARPDRRHASAGELERDLMIVAPHGSSAVASAPRSGAARRPGQLLAAAFVVLAGTWLAFDRWRQPVDGGAAKPADRSVAQADRDAGTPEDDGEASSGAHFGPVTPGAVAEPMVASAALLLEQDGQSRALAPGDAVALGQGVALMFQAAEPAYVYVLDEDRTGAVYVLFPAPGIDVGNPLPAGLRRLPGTRGGRPLSWQVTSPGGGETVIVIASRTALPELEREIARFPSASLERPVVYGRMSESTLTVLRGIGGMTSSPGPDQAGSAVRLSQVVRNAWAAGAVPWTWQIELDSPHP